jgi:hypothetical protein
MENTKEYHVEILHTSLGERGERWVYDSRHESIDDAQDTANDIYGDGVCVRVVEMPSERIVWGVS